MEDRHSYSNETVILPSTHSAPGLDIIDPIERLRRTIRTPEPVSPRETDPADFLRPVESAVEIETSALSLPVESQVCVRDGQGEMIEEVQLGETATYPEGTYCIEPPWIVKLYIRVESSVEIVQEDPETHIDFGEEVTVRVGSCSTHERPATTVTISPEEGDLLRAISTFGSALKTLSPERAFPSHRGHPPRVEVGDELVVPKGLDPPAEDLRIEVPPVIADAFVIAPLAYYLGAEVREGPTARIVGDGLDYALPYDGDLEAGVERTLQQLYLLDCITRTEGVYQVDLHEREQFEDRFDLPLEHLYDAPHAERVRTYLRLEYDELADLIPAWKHAAHVEPSLEHASTLPYLVDDLAVIKTGVAEPVPAADLRDGTVQGMVRGETLVRGGVTTDTEFVSPATSADAIEEAWVGEGTPIGASKALPTAFENRIGRATSTGSIDIAVVCNDTRMAHEEDAVDDVYGSREEMPFDVSVRTGTTTDELAEIIAEDRDFFHYIGHIDENGFRCADGRLGTGAIDAAGMDAFFLNACQSYHQGLDLVEAGAIGGIVTLRDVANFGALQIGQAVARLLNSGFPLRPALSVARDESIIGSHYLVVGDGGLSIVQPESGTPLLYQIDSAGDGYELSIDLFGAHPGMGGVFNPHLTDAANYHLASGEIDGIHLDAEELEAFLDREDFPVRRNGWLSWSNELTIEQL